MSSPYRQPGGQEEPKPIKYPTPSEAGLYWATGERNARAGTWRYIAEVYGTAPFLEVRVWVIGSKDVFRVKDDDFDRIIWGPKLLPPPTQQVDVQPPPFKPTKVKPV